MSLLIRVHKEENPKDWVKGWSNSLKSCLDNIKEISNLPNTPGSFAVKFKKILNAYEYYNVVDIPMEILGKILTEEVKSMDGVRVNVNEEERMVSLLVEQLEIKFSITNGDVVKLKDHVPHLYPQTSPHRINPYIRTHAIAYSRFKSGKISKLELRKEFSAIAKARAIKEDIPGLGVRRFFNSMKDIYLKSSFKVVSEHLDEVLACIEEENEILRENGKRKASTKEREAERIRILEVSGISKLLQEMKDAGIEISSDGPWEIRWETAHE